jgi:hypothetical protein
VAHDKDKPSKRAAKLLRQLQRTGPPGTLAGLAAPRLDINIKTNPALRAVFAAAGLDHRKPDHWKFLVAVFAAAHFPEAPRGAPRRRTTARLCQLLADLEVAKKEAAGKPRPEIYKLLVNKKKFDGRYADEVPETIRRQIADARNPKKNEFLGRALDKALRHQRGRASREQILDMLIGFIADDWKPLSE